MNNSAKICLVKLYINITTLPDSDTGIQSFIIDVRENSSAVNLLINISIGTNKKAIINYVHHKGEDIVPYVSDNFINYICGELDNYILEQNNYIGAKQ
jgi:hypothetical protein